MTPQPPSRRAYIFVCQSGELEIKALLLAASLRRHLGDTAELIAAVPGPAQTWGELSGETLEQLRRFGARVVPIANPIDASYPIGNKLACIDVPASAPRLAFLDSDMLCLRDPGDAPALRSAFAAKPADLRTFAAAAEVWRPLYAAAAVEMPSLRLPTTVSGEFGLPYFNSGAIFVDNGLRFGSAWIDCARILMHEPSMREQRHWLDQVSLPIAVHRLRLPYSALDERFNFPAHLKPLDNDVPFFCHYHWPRIIRREPALLAFVRELAREHPLIAQVVARDAAWHALLAGDDEAPRDTTPPRRLPSPPRAPIFITGLPGAGADRLVHALASRGDCVVRELPVTADAALADAAPPWELAAFAREAQAEAGAARTLVVDAGQRLLCRLDALRRVLPQARVAVCVAGPAASVGVWKARAQQTPAEIEWIARCGERFLPAAALAQLRHVAGIEDDAERRAAAWWWLAQRVLDRGEDDAAVRIRGAAGAPARAAAALLGGGDGRAVMDDTCAGSQADAIASDARDAQAIRAICLQAAAELGVADDC